MSPRGREDPTRDDPWFHFVYDDSWRIVATYRADHAGGWAIDSGAKERFVYHNAGLDGLGGSSYIDAVILRDRDADNDTTAPINHWAAPADATPEERIYYVQNWRADVVALTTGAGQLIQQVRYDPYGVPFGIPKTDLDGDGDSDSADSTLFNTYYTAGTMPFADWNWDGTKNSTDAIAYFNDNGSDADLGRGVLGYGFDSVGGNSRKGYAGYEEALELEGVKPGTYHVRHRVYVAELGRWNKRDPLGYVDGTSLYSLGGGNPILGVDAEGLAWAAGDGGGDCGGDCGGPSAQGAQPVPAGPPPLPAPRVVISATCPAGWTANPRVAAAIAAATTACSGPGRCTTITIRCTNRCNQAVTSGCTVTVGPRCTGRGGNRVRTPPTTNLVHELQHVAQNCLFGDINNAASPCRERICRELDAYIAAGQCALLTPEVPGGGNGSCCDRACESAYRDTTFCWRRKSGCVATCQALRAGGNCAGGTYVPPPPPPPPAGPPAPRTPLPPGGPGHLYVRAM